MSAFPIASPGRARGRARPRRRGLSRRWLLAWLAAPIAVRLTVGIVALIAIWSAVNWVYQVTRKPTELFFPLSAVLDASPRETWRRYEPLFRAHATATMRPELLAALAQVEAAGNPVARTYWRWQLAWNPFEIYRPASSAVGMYQMTDGTFRDAQRSCVRDNVAIESDPRRGDTSCWFTSFYSRVVPSHAMELTSAHLDRNVARTLVRHRLGRATLAQKQELAAVIHLCGAGVGDAYARRGFRLLPGQRCGDQHVHRYLASVNAMKRQFLWLADGPSIRAQPPSARPAGPA
jgi:hypothetical protein